MDELPRVEATYAPQPAGLDWPTSQWSRGIVTRQDDLERAADRAFGDEALGETNAVVVVKGGRIVFERYGGSQPRFDGPAETITAGSQLLSWSMAKSILHLVVGTLVDQGQLDPHEPAPVPEWSAPGDPRRAIRLGDLLAMRDGLAFTEAYEIGERSDVIEMLFGDGKDDVAGYVARLGLAHEPGTHFNYSSGTSNVLSRIVADVVGHGDAYREYLDRHVFAPLGMTSAVATFDATGVFVASSFVHAKALDFARFGLLYLRGGEWDGRRLVSRDWTDTAQVPHSRDEESGHYYSWHWWVSGDRFGTYWASGYEGQMISVVPSLDALVLRFGHTAQERYPALYRWRASVLESLAPDQAPS
jgi:CubicO group peptidase (beta-lactamase class C family)